MSIRSDSFFCYLIAAEDCRNFGQNQGPLEEAWKWCQNGESFFAIRVRNGASRRRWWDAHDFPGFWGKIMDNPCISKVPPFLLANRGCGLPKFWVKLRASGGGWGWCQNGESFFAIRVWNGASPDGDRLSVIFPDFEEKSWSIHVSPNWLLF